MRAAQGSDAGLVTEILTDAFHEDPTWSWVFSDAAARPSQYRRFWGLLVAGALRHSWVWLAPAETSAAVWIPPGGTELSPEQEHQLDAYVGDLPETTADRLRAALEAFEQGHPHEAPHYYLSLLGTDPRHLGHGYGLALLADNLRRVDLEGMPAYLEASNPANVPLYERYGFRQVGSFTIFDGPEVPTMWRDPR